MAKTKPDRNPHPKTRIAVTGLTLLLSVSIVFANPAITSADEARWSRVNIPTEGKVGNWVLADGSDIKHLTMASDGTLYAYAQGLTYTLYKSTDDGYSWSYTGKVQDSIVDIAISPNDTGLVYYATTSKVYRSTDGGKTFAALTANPGGAGSNNVEITSIDVTWLNGNIVTVGTRDTDSSQFGGVYTLDEDQILSRWTDTGVGSYDVYAVAFSPNFSSDRQLTAVITDETDTYVTTKIGDVGWGIVTGNARLDKDNSGTPTPIAVATSAVIAFPNPYDSDTTSENHALFIGIDAGSDSGDVYRIDGAEAPDNSIATDLNAGAVNGLNNLDITGLAVNGNTASANLLAGAANSTQTYSSTDGGKNWAKYRKEPTGGSKTYVLMAPDFSSSHRAYAATSGSESALSISRDKGIYWNQIGLIDTGMSTIVDFAPSPDYSRDNTLFMLTFGGEHSLWRSLDNGTVWERIFSSDLTNVDSISQVELSPEYGTDRQVVLLTGTGGGNPVTWQSTNNGQKFTRWIARDPDTGATLTINTLAVVNDNDLLISSYNGSSALVYHSANGGFFYSAGAPAGNQSLNSLVLSPRHDTDKSILAGNTNGWVYWSTDNGTSFEPLPPDATSAPLTGYITVAFDPKFESNNIVYAASNTADKGVYRFTIGTSTGWERIDSTLPSGGTLDQLTVLSDGTLYATDSKADAGMERCLNPTYSLGPSFETVTRGLSDGATLSELWQHGHTLWTIDSTNIKLLTFTDRLTPAVIPISPSNQAPGIGILINHTISNVVLDWETLPGATSYKWQLDYDTDFSTVPAGFEGDTKVSSARMPSLEPTTTYYWRVKATAPVLSSWSDKWSFTTSLDSEAIALKLESPKPGARDVAVKPVFQWTGITAADTYELLVSTDVHFSNPSIIKIGTYAISSTVWESNTSLNYDTTYYWKVRAANSDTHSPWSAVGAFTTLSPPEAASPAISLAAPAVPKLPIPEVVTQTPLPEPAPTALSQTPRPAPKPPAPPAPPVAQPATTPLWVIYLIGGLLLTIILSLIIVLVMVAAIRRI